MGVASPDFGCVGIELLEFGLGLQGRWCEGCVIAGFKCCFNVRFDGSSCM